jgi:methionyl-tRNA formyltransferase
MRVGLIGNVNAVFPLLEWLHAQGILAGVSVIEKDNEYFKDFEAFCLQKKIKATIFKKPSMDHQLKNWVKAINADLVLVMGFPSKIKKEILLIPKHGFFNIHFGKLPKYGGAFPVFWQIKNQEPQATLTIHQMDESYDTGPIVCELNFEINSQMNFAMVELNFGYLAINGVYFLVDALLRNTLQFLAQSIKKPVFLKKPGVKDIIIDWKNKNAAQIVALVKACNPWNKGAISKINGYDLKILEANAVHFPDAKPGEVIHIDENQILVGCLNDSALGIKLILASVGYLAGETLATIGIKKGDVFEGILT